MHETVSSVCDSANDTTSQEDVQDSRPESPTSSLTSDEVLPVGTLTGQAKGGAGETQVQQVDSESDDSDDEEEIFEAMTAPTSIDKLAQLIGSTSID